MEVTLNQLKDWEDCTDGYKKVLKSVGGKYDKDAPIKLSSILKSNGIDDTFWCINRLTLTPEQEKDFRLLACDYAERVLPLFEKDHANDSRVKNCIDVARRFAHGNVGAEELAAARAAAWDASKAAARDADWDAARAAVAAVAAARAAGAAVAAVAAGAASCAAGAAEKAAQTEMLLELLLKYEV